MAALGVYPGNEIELISPSNGERCLIKVHGGTISIDRHTTENILITE
jgi:Fe2+ transport system protein FeoA